MLPVSCSELVVAVFPEILVEFSSCFSLVPAVKRRQKKKKKKIRPIIYTYFRIRNS